MRLAKLVQRCPLLPLPADILPLILADIAVVGWTFGFGELRAAGGADEVGHNRLTFLLKAEWRCSDRFYRCTPETDRILS